MSRRRSQFPPEGVVTGICGRNGACDVQLTVAVPHGKRSRDVTLALKPAFILALADAIRCCPEHILETHRTGKRGPGPEATLVNLGHAVWHLEHPDRPRPCLPEGGQIIDVMDGTKLTAGAPPNGPRMTKERGILAGSTLSLPLTTARRVPSGRMATLSVVVHDTCRFDAVKLVVTADSAIRTMPDGPPRFRVDELRVDGHLLIGRAAPYRSFDDLADGSIASRAWIGLPVEAGARSEVLVKFTNRGERPAVFSATLLMKRREAPACMPVGALLKRALP